MNLSDFNFPFDPTLVAKHPIHPRDHARLLVQNRYQGKIIDRQVKEQFREVNKKAFTAGRDLVYA